MIKLFVRVEGLNRNISREDRVAMMQHIFSPFFQVEEENVTIITDKEYGGYRNFMFVSTDDDDAANQAITALNDTSTDDGYNINVNEAKPMEDRPRTGGGMDRKPRSGGYSAGGSSRGGSSYGNNDYGNGGGSRRGGNSY
jgi:RNA recognition motif-containing protein